MDWDMLFFPKHFYIWTIAGITLMGLLIVLIASFSAKDEKRSLLVLQWAYILAALSPIVITLPMVFHSHAGKIPALEVVTTYLASEKVVVLARGIAEFKSYWFLGGLALIVLCALGFVCVFTSWLRLGRSVARSILPVLALGGYSIAFMVSGLGLVIRSVVLMNSYSAVSFADFAEKRILLERSIFDAPNLSPYLIVATTVLLITCLIIIGLTIVNNKGLPQLGRWSLAPSVVVLILGVGLFTATRDHASDADSISKLFQTIPRDGDILFIEKDIQIPDLKNTQSLDQALVILMGKRHIAMEGRSIGAIDAVMADENLYISRLQELLEKSKQNHKLLYPHQEFVGQIILQCDRDTPGQAVAKVVRTCHQSEFRKIQIASGGLLKVTTAVLGDYVRYRPRAVHIELTEGQKENVIDLPGQEKFWQWADKIDRSSADGRKVLISVEQAL